MMCILIMNIACHRIAVESLRQFINRPIIAIFSENLENPTTEQMLCSLLESLLKRSSTLIPILIPPCSNGTTNETLQQYAGNIFASEQYMICQILYSIMCWQLYISSIHNLVVWDNVLLDIYAIKQCGAFK